MISLHNTFFRMALKKKEQKEIIKVAKEKKRGTQKQRLGEAETK